MVLVPVPGLHCITHYRSKRRYGMAFWRGRSGARASRGEVFVSFGLASAGTTSILGTIRCANAKSNFSTAGLGGAAWAKN
jgi:hypothetical protein